MNIAPNRKLPINFEKQAWPYQERENVHRKKAILSAKGNFQMPNILENVDMKQHTTFRAGGCARYFAKAESVDDIRELQKFAIEKEIPFFLIGLGSNVLVSDAGFDGLIIKLGKEFSHFKFDKDKLAVKAATPLSLIARTSATLGLSGMHLLAGIPGTIGGGIAMNAGAYGEEISQTLLSATVLEEDGSIKDYSNADCRFGYRKSVFQNTYKVILEATFQLETKGSAELLAAQKKIMDERKAKQPLELPSAGSVFKRPANGFPGALIEQVGLKGFQIGGAQISPKHANFIVNTGNATAQQIYDLSEMARQKVLDSCGIQLEREIIFLGKFRFPFSIDRYVSKDAATAQNEASDPGKG